MSANGFIKVYRSLIDWEWYKDQNTKDVFLHLLLIANYKQNKWSGITIEPGQTVTSYAKISEGTGISVQSVRTSINRLKSTGEITYQSTNKYSVITLCNWAIYQSSDDELTSKSTDELTNNQQATNKQLTTNKNSNKDNKEKKIDSVKTNIKIPEHLIDTFDAYIEMRNKMKKPMTEKAKELALKSLFKLSDNPEEQVAILEQSIEHSWLSLFEIKNNNRFNQPTKQREVPLTEVEDGLFKIG